MMLAVMGTRPEAIKMAPVVAAFEQRGLPLRTAVTGQHSAPCMMDDILQEARLRVEHRLLADSARRGDRLGEFVAILDAVGSLCSKLRPRLVLAVGDTTTAVAAALAARKTGAAFGHIEAGLRAFSRELPEEEHRICADALSELLFAPTPIAVENLRRERVNGRIHLTGNPILDATRGRLRRPAAQRKGILCTIHRQETVDDPHRLAQVLFGLSLLSARDSVEWPMHPRTQAKVAEFRLRLPPLLRIQPPAPRAVFLSQLERTRMVVTDSGGVQEEAAILGVPCLTVRRHTERPETVRAGLSLLAAPDAAAMVQAAERLLACGPDTMRPRPELYGDGTAGDKIARICAAWLRSSLH